MYIVDNIVKEDLYCYISNFYCLVLTTNIIANIIYSKSKRDLIFNVKLFCCLKVFLNNFLQIILKHSNYQVPQCKYLSVYSLLD